MVRCCIPKGPPPPPTLTCAWTIRSWGASQHLSAWQSVQGGLGARLGAHRSVNTSYYKLPSRKTFPDANSGKNHSTLHSGGHLHGLDATLGLSCSPSPLPLVCRGVPHTHCPNHGRGRQGQLERGRSKWTGKCTATLQFPKGSLPKGEAEIRL